MDTNKARAKFLSNTSAPRKLVTIIHKFGVDEGLTTMGLKLSDAGTTPINFRHTASQCGDDIEITIQGLVTKMGANAVDIALWPADFCNALRLLVEDCGGHICWPDEDDGK